MDKDRRAALRSRIQRLRETLPPSCGFCDQDGCPGATDVGQCRHLFGKQQQRVLIRLDDAGRMVVS